MNLGARMALVGWGGVSGIRGASTSAERPACLQVAGKGRRKECSLHYARRRSWGKRKGKKSRLIRLWAAQILARGKGASEGANRTCREYGHFTPLGMPSPRLCVGLVSCGSQVIIDTCENPEARGYCRGPVPVGQDDPFQWRGSRSDNPACISTGFPLNLLRSYNLRARLRFASHPS